MLAMIFSCPPQRVQRSISTPNNHSGQYLYVVNIGGAVSEYSINSNGTLNSIGSIGAGTDPFGIAIEATDHYVYVTNNVDGTISEYSIGTGGVLSNIGTITADSGSGVDKIVAEPTGKYIYVTNSTANTVEEFQIGSGGQLTKFGTATPGTYPRTIIVDHSGKYVYDVDNHATGSYDTISEFSIGSGGALTPIGTANITSGTSPFDITLDATGQFAYVPLLNTNVVAEYSINPTTGVLTLIGSVATGVAPSGVATIH